jgi:hypothetical protein
MSFRGRTVCSLACATSLRDAERKLALDAMDLNPVVCRCEGAPAPLETHGIHCRDCRRMFSAQVRLWLATEHESAGRIARIRLGYERLMTRPLFQRRHSVSPAL